MVCDCCSPGDPTDGLKAYIRPYSERGCTDVLFLLAFMMSWGVIFFLLGWTVDQGANPQVVIRGTDWEGMVCGKTGYEDFPYAAWPDPYYGFNVKVCVKNCNVTENWEFSVQFETLALAYSYCIPLAVYEGNVNDTFIAKLNASSAIDDSQFASTKSAAQRAMGDMLTAWPIILASAGVALGLSFLYTYFTQKCGYCLLFILVLFISVAGFLAGYAILKDAYAQGKDPIISYYAQTSLLVQKVVGWVFVVATFIFLIILFAIRKQLFLALEVIKEAAEAIQDMPTLLCFPVFPFIVGMAYVALWIAVCCYIFSVTNPVGRPVDALYPADVFTLTPSKIAKMPEPFATYLDTSTGGAYSASTKFSYLDFEFKRLNNATLKGIPNINNRYHGNYTDLIWNQKLQNAFAVNFFHLLWVVQFIIYFTYLVFAGAVAEWYFSVRDSAGNKQRGESPNNLSHTPCKASFARTCRFHLGSVAFGSLIIATIQFLRACVHYVESKVKSQTNQFQKAVFCMLKCCLYCIQCCCDKISRNGFVWIAIWGDDFTTAACCAFKLVWANLVRIAALNLVGEYLLLMGKFMCSVATAGIGAFLLEYQYGSAPAGRLSSIMMPTFVCFVIGYMVVSFFMALFEVTIDTIFLCFLIDEKCNKGTGNMFASESLQKLVDKYHAQSFAMAKDQNAPGTKDIDFAEHQRSMRELVGVNAGKGPSSSKSDIATPSYGGRN
eukprot:gb/GEZN01002893.1/.p1 GENE.gb/GEZN01002893.1/~~gb/GEZN01002893.1/.p1  ORF type:complete len:720 (+),score=43.70 gb/GEZN01002893.1/:64-2223(+)